MVLAGAVLPFAPGTATAAAGDPRPVPPALTVELTTAGFNPETVSLTVGQTLIVHNATAAARQIDAADGSVGSGPIPPDARLVTAFPAPAAGRHDLADDAAPTPHHLTVSVGQLVLPGNPLSPISYGIPGLPPAPVASDPHPTLGVYVARNRVMLSFLPGATIGMVNDALAAGGLTVVGGYPRFGLIVTEVAGNPNPSDPRTIQPAIDAVRGMPGIGAASFDLGLSRETSLPRPTAPDPGGLAHPYDWDGTVDPDGDARGYGGNWGLESSRFPQAWNLLDAAKSRLTFNQVPPSIVVLDSGFQMGHPDLAGAEIHELCAATVAGPMCTTNTAAPDGSSGNHGTSTAGIIGAAFDRDGAGGPTAPNSTGSVGADPLAKLHLVPWTASQPVQKTDIVQFYEFATEIDLVLDHRTALFPNLRAINVSAGPVGLIDDGAAWRQEWFGKTCGASAGDDGTASERVPCTPANEDAFLQEMANYAAMYTGIATVLAQGSILFVNSAGNESHAVCLTAPGPLDPCTTYAPLPAVALNPFALLDKKAGGESPFLDVEAHTVDLKRAFYSSTDGLVSAPADDNVTPGRLKNGTFGYQLFNGTSAAAPYVTALAGLLAALRPSSSFSEVKDAIIDSARGDIEGGADRIDAFAAILRMPGGLEGLLDVNDPSLDGNRRVIYDDAGAPLGDDTVSAGNGGDDSAPDGAIDIRDFRRFRDAYLAECAAGDPGCPTSAQIGLDGAPTHPKKDGNLDRCSFAAGSPCDYTEGWYSRFDFNGDGTLLPRQVDTPIGPDGGPPAAGEPAQKLTDLDVFRLWWPDDPAANPEATGGWSKTDLDRLVSSADVEVRLDQLWEEGATEAKVSAYTLDSDAPTRTFIPAPAGDSRVFTVPLTLTADGTDDLVQVRVEATMPDDPDPHVFLSDLLPAKAGSDLVVKPCTGQLTIEAADKHLALGGHTTIRAGLQDCFGKRLANRDVEFVLVESPGGALTGATKTDANGIATVTYTHPEGVNGPVRVGAVFHNALKGDPLTATVDLDAIPDYTVHYHFRQSILDYERRSTNDWPGGGDDCDSPVEVANPRFERNCFSSVQTFGETRQVFSEPVPGQVEVTTIDPGTPVIERKGTISPNGSGGATVVEQARLVGVRNNEFVQFQSGAATTTVVTQWKPGDPASAETRTFDSWSFLAGQRLPNGNVGTDFTPPETFDLPDVHFIVQDDALEVSGLDQLSRRSLHDHEGFARQRSGLIDDYALHPDVPVTRFTLPGSNPPDFSVGPRSDGSGFKFQADPTDTLLFTPDNTPAYCAIVDRSLNNRPGYWSDTDPQLSPEVRDTDDQYPVREPGDRAAPLHTGHIRSKFEFSAILSPTGGDAEPPPFPTLCPDEAPAVSFSHAPVPVTEGREITFTDTSDNAAKATSHSWDFGDGSPLDTDDAPTHRFADNVTYPVTMTVTDELGIVHTSPAVPVEVKNANPTVSIEGILDPPQQPTIQVLVDDPSDVDRTQLEVRITSPTAGFPTVAPQFLQPPPGGGSPGGLEPGPYLGLLTLPPINPGVYFVIITVLDKDGGSAKATMSLAVSAAPPPSSSASSASSSTSSSAASPVSSTAWPSDPTATATGGATAAAAVAPARVPAFVVDDTGVMTGETVTVRNASRLDGAPADALVDPGDGRPPIPLAAGASTEVAWLAAGTFALAMATSEVAATIELTVSGPAVPPTISFESAASAAQGALAPMVARVTGAGGGPLVGVTVRFVLANAPGTTVDAVTGSDGRASTALPLTGPAGATGLLVTVLPDTSTSIPFTVVANAAPVASAGGPYTISPDDALDLHATATDADPAHAGVLAFAWDVDGDGAFDDAFGADPSLPAAQVQVLLCGGGPLPCTPGSARDVRVQARDPLGGTGTATATVTFIKDFAISMSPSSALLVPNAWTAFSVKVSTTTGFDQPVSLETVGLPAGISASFNPTTITPTGTAVLSLHASDSIAAQTFPLVVRATGGGLVRQTSTSVELDFGLLPVCTGAVEGYITDRETGAGIPGIGMFDTQTDADGYYFADGIALGSGNSSIGVSRELRLDGYYRQLLIGSASCGITTVMSGSLLKQRFGALAGTVTGVAADGVTALGPIAGAKVLGATTDANGHYQIDQVQLGGDNAPAVYAVGAQGPAGSGYFNSPNTQVRIEADQLTTQDFVLRQACFGSIRAQVLDARTRQPFPATYVNGLLTDAQGVVTLTDLPLGGPDNRPRAYNVTARTPADLYPVATQSKNVTVAFCGGITPVTLELAQPHNVVATVDLTVVDDETDEPIPFANTVVQGRYFGQADEQGHIRADFLLGVDVGPDLEVIINAGKDGYWQKPNTTITLHEGQVSFGTVRLLAKRKGVVEGTVRDRETGAPLAGMVVSVGSGGGYTGADGRYRFDAPLGPGNTPIDETIQAWDDEAPVEFWRSERTPITVSGTETATADLTMLRICRGATVRGRVINALTGDPLEGAFVIVQGAPSSYDTTGADGRFVLTDIGVADENKPQTYSIRASKDGFVTATKTVTIFCGADIVVDFGRTDPADATITGHVTNEAGDPVSGAFVGTGFGGSDQTDTDGVYTITQVPVGDGGTPADWSVTVQPPAGSGLVGATKTATVTPATTTTLDFVLGAPVNEPPTAIPLTYEGEQDTPISLLLAGSDPNADPLTFAVVDPPAHGALSGVAPALTYTPDGGYAGTDTFTYTVSDAEHTSAPATVTLDIALPNQAPTAIITTDPAGEPTTVDEGEGVALTGAASTDPDGEIVSWEWDLDGDGVYDDDVGEHAWADHVGPGTVTIGLRVTDDEGATATTSIELTWVNVAPVLEIGGDDVVPTNVIFVREWYAEDAGGGPLTATVSWGDGTPTEDLDVGNGEDGELSHVFAGPGTFLVTVQVCDEEPLCASGQFQVQAIGSGPTTTTSPSTTTTSSSTTTSTSTTSTTVPTSTTTTTVPTSTTTTSTTSTTSSTSTSTSTTAPSTTTSSTSTTTTAPTSTSTSTTSTTSTTAPPTTTSTSTTSTTSTTAPPTTTSTSTTSTTAPPTTTSTSTSTSTSTTAPSTTTSSTPTTTTVPPATDPTTTSTPASTSTSTTSSSSLAPSTTLVPTTVDPSAAAAVAGVEEGRPTRGTLPVTGSGTTAPALAAILLLAGSAVLLLDRRARR